MHSEVDIKVRGYHVDVFGHVNHGRIVEFLEEARWSFFDDHRPVVDRLHARGLLHAVVRLEVDYRASAGGGDSLKIHTSIREVGRTSVVVAQRIRRLEDDSTLVDAAVTNVFLDGATGRPAFIRDELVPLQAPLRDDADGSRSVM